MPSSMLVMRQRYLTRKQNGICIRYGGVCPQYGKGHVDHEHKMVESQIKQMKVYA